MFLTIRLSINKKYHIIAKEKSMYQNHDTQYKIIVNKFKMFIYCLDCYLFMYIINKIHT